MKKTLTIVLLICFFNTNAQESFLKGYIVNKDNVKTECFIKDEQWKNNPNSFSYKLSKDGKTLTGDKSNVVEFSVPNSFKYKLTSINVDKHIETYADLGKNRIPEYKKETAYLRVVVEGSEVVLFELKKTNFSRLFYQKKSGDVILLRFNKYRLKTGKVGRNNSYKIQLSDDLKVNCKKMKYDLPYSVSKIGDLIVEYNRCAINDYR